MFVYGNDRTRKKERERGRDSGAEERPERIDNEKKKLPS